MGVASTLAGRAGPYPPLDFASRAGSARVAERRSIGRGGVGKGVGNPLGASGLLDLVYLPIQGHCPEPCIIHRTMDFNVKEFFLKNFRVHVESYLEHFISLVFASVSECLLMR